MGRWTVLENLDGRGSACRAERDVQFRCHLFDHGVQALSAGHITQQRGLGYMSHSASGENRILLRGVYDNVCFGVFHVLIMVVFSNTELSLRPL